MEPQVNEYLLADVKVKFDKDEYCIRAVVVPDVVEEVPD